MGGCAVAQIKSEVYIKLAQFPANLIQSITMNFQLDSVIEVLLSSDNQRRIEAEAYINEIPITCFEQGIDAFLLSMNHENPNVAAMGALLLKKKYLDTKENLRKIPRDKLEMMVTSVTACMTANRQVMFLKRCCEILVKIYAFAEQHAELIHVIQSLANVDAHNMKLALMYLIEIICEFAFDDEQLMQYSSGLEVIFQRGLADQSNEVQVAAFKTLTIFLSAITEEKNMKKFESVLKTLISKAIQLIKFDQESGMTALESLNELVEAHPKFIRPIFENLLMVYSEIMETGALLVNLRTTAMVGVLTLCMHHHTLVRKNSYFKTKMIASYMNMLAEVHNTSLEEWAEELLDEVISKNDIAMSTEEHLSQIANELGNKFMLPLFIPYIQKCLSSTEFQYQHAGLTALAILVENCHQSYKGELKNMIGLMLPLLQSQHPRIIYDILIAMGYMCDEFSPEIQVNFGSMILEFISKALNHSMLKVQHKAVLCIVNFAQGLMDHREVTVMHPYLEGLLGHLARIFENSLLKSNYIMLEAVLESIATIASINDFSRFYGSFMPGLTRIIGMISSDTPQKVNIKSKTIQAMGEILTSIKDSPELFVPECTNIMQSLISLQSQIDREDVLHRAIFTVYEKVVGIVKGQFSVYSDFIFQIALEAAARKIDVQIIDQTDAQKSKGNPMHQYVKVKLDLKIDGVKNIVLNTDTFEQKVEATNLLAAMAEHMGEAFVNYVPALLPVVRDLIIIKNSREMRENMVQLCQYMVLSGRNAEEKTAILINTHPLLVSALSEAIKNKDHNEVSAITESLSAVMPFMNQQMMARLPDMMMAVIAMVKDLVKSIEKVYSEKEMDDDLNEEMNNETGEVEDVLSTVEEIMNRGKGIPAFDTLRKHFPSDYEFEQ